MKISLLLLLGTPIAFAAPMETTSSGSKSSLDSAVQKMDGTKAALADLTARAEAHVPLQPTYQDEDKESSRNQTVDHSEAALNFVSLQNDHQYHNATTGQGELQRRGRPSRHPPPQDIDRRQKDRNKLIDFSLLSPCIERCFRESNRYAPKSLDVVTLDEFCTRGNPWKRWLSWGPLHCWAIHCRKDEKPVGISRRWASVNCGW